MKHISRVLAAVDFSVPARSAYDHALALARHHAAELVVIQAVPAEHSFNRHREERRALAASLRQLASEAQVEFAYRVQHGDPAEIILLHAASVRPDVIVVGSHQRQGLERLRAGSVSERVVAKTSIPVLVVPAGLRLTATGSFRHVAVAVALRDHGRPHHEGRRGSSAGDPWYRHRSWREEARLLLGPERFGR